MDNNNIIIIRSEEEVHSVMGFNFMDFLVAEVDNNFNSISSLFCMGEIRQLRHLMRAIEFTSFYYI